MVVNESTSTSYCTVQCTIHTTAYMLYMCDYAPYKLYMSM